MKYSFIWEIPNYELNNEKGVMVMYITLKGDCEKIICTQMKEKKVLYNGDKIKMGDNIPISFSSIATQKKEIWKCIFIFPLRLIGVLFDILLMNYEWDWIEKFEPCTFQIDGYVCNPCDDLEIKCNKSRFDKKREKIIRPEITINGEEIKEIKCYAYTENLKLCFLKCCLKIIGILIWCLIPLGIITINAKKYSVYVLLIDLMIIVMVTVKILLEYQKFCSVNKKICLLNNHLK